MEKSENIELRSEKVRNLIGKVPVSLIRNGIMIITTLLISLLISSIYIPYPENMEIDVRVVKYQTNIKVVSYIPYASIANIDNGLPVQIELEGYNSYLFGTIEGCILNVDKNVYKIKDKNYFKITIGIADLTHRKSIEIKNGLSGVGYILISNDSILTYVLNKMLRS